MAGLYIHIPFCASRCIYCGFFSTTRHAMRDRYVDALCRELTLRKNYLHDDIHTIYIGGGTPSMLTSDQLERLFAHIDCSKAEEVTMECNPDDVTPELAATISRLPINRISIGAQTFNDSRLRFLRRRHSASDIGRAVTMLREAGIDNISIDLMYGFPDETMEDWRDDIAQATALGVEHLSAYSLTYEEDTPLYHMLKEGKVTEVNEETSAAMYYELIDRLNAVGYEHYEISNWARPGYRSRHNSSYWTGIPYIGIGAAAHSYDNESRQWNVADIDGYIAAIERDEIPMERETLDQDTHYNDTVMLRLRTIEGLCLDSLALDLGPNYRRHCLNSAKRYIYDGKLEHTHDGRLRLTRSGLFVSDMIMSDLMRV